MNDNGSNPFSPTVCRYSTTVLHLTCNQGIIGSTPIIGSMENPYLKKHRHENDLDFCDGCIQALQHEELIETQRETNILLNDLLEEIRRLNRTQENMMYKVEAIKDKF